MDGMGQWLIENAAVLPQPIPECRVRTMTCVCSRRLEVHVIVNTGAGSSFNYVDPYQRRVFITPLMLMFYGSSGYA
jgi:hypothetical protein